MSVFTSRSKTDPPQESFDRDGAIPLLESGDRLTRDEFERRYEAMQDLKKAELVKGVVYVGSPVRQRDHGKPHYHLLSWLGQYELIAADRNGVLRGTVFPGLWLDATALLRGDLGAVLAVVRQGLSTPDHETFCKQLQGAGPKP
jgi:hypothetical protein